MTGAGSPSDVRLVCASPLSFCVLAPRGVCESFHLFHFRVTSICDLSFATVRLPKYTYALFLRCIFYMGRYSLMFRVSIVSS